ncbi:hypothetical protein IQ07DRAFT_341419 [Pyrenochaeta sp. DS3sAY3a]|nr:hypothetical protein IQ07DRAFT_341419 [Pyrenochaeta sp. DS3sAY3a]
MFWLEPQFDYLGIIRSCYDIQNSALLRSTEIACSAYSNYLASRNYAKIFVRVMAGLLFTMSMETALAIRINHCTVLR